jgi:D-sedoheptulose 7-phosphate isomerase
MNNIKALFLESINIKKEIIEKELYLSIIKMGKKSSSAIINGNKIMLCGNGGSAADAQHLAAEMLVRLRPKNNREGIPAIALAQDTSTITACGNDFGYDQLFGRLVQTLGRKGDILIAISTSGNSENIILAMKAAKKIGVLVFGFLGSQGGKAYKYCDEVFIVPSDNTGRIQESHITAGHALMELIEDELLSSGHITLQNN